MFAIKKEEISYANRLRMGMAFFGIVRDINRTDDVFAVSERIPDQTLEPALDFLKQGKWAKKAFTEQPMLCPNIPELARLPDGTLGKEYAEFMIRRGLSPDFYPAIELTSEMKYFRVHLYQTHDLWHILTGFRADPAGEVGLQAFYLAQTESPLPPILIAAAILNSALYNPEDMTARFDAIVKGWKMGKDAEKLFGFPWADHWAMPLSEVRKITGVNSTLTAVPAVGEDAGYNSKSMTFETQSAS